jgi:hypothetical protein
MKQPRVNSHRRFGCTRIDPGNLAIRAVKTQLRFQPLDLLKRLLSRGPEAHRFIAAEHKLEPSSHGVERKGDYLCCIQSLT